MLPFTRMQPHQSSGGDGHISRGLKLKNRTAEEEIATMVHSFGALPPLSRTKTRAKTHGLAACRGGKRMANATRTTTEPPPPPVIDHDITPKTSHRKSRSCPDTVSTCHIIDSTCTNPLPRHAVPRDNADVFQDLVGDAPDLDCHVCSNSLCKRKSVALVRCGHIFHQCCLEMSLQHNRTCPICHVPVGNDDNEDNNESSSSSRSTSSLVMLMEEHEAAEDDDREEDVSSRTSGSTARRSIGSIILENSDTLDEDETSLTQHRLRTQAWAAPPPLLIPTPSAERGSITEILNMSPAAESFYDVATAASSLLFSATRRPSDERRRRLDNIAAGGLAVNSISRVDEIVYNDFEKAIQEGDLDKAYVHGWRYCYFCLAYSITGRNLSKVVRLLEFVVKQMDEHDRQRRLIESPADRAAKFVSSLNELFDRLRGSRVESAKDQPKQRQSPTPIFHLIQPLNEDDVRCMAEEMLKKQAQLQAFCSTSANIALAVDIGYLYMHESSLDCVMTDGLLITSDGHAPSILHSCVASYGNGVYTSNNPYAYHDPRGGQVGVLVARLKGVQKECFMDEGMNGIIDAEYDSVQVIGDDPRVNMTVLRQTSQCLPLAYFPNAVIEPGNSWAWGNYAMTEIHAELQKLIDEFFNNAQATSLRVVEPFVSSSFLPGRRAGEARPIREPTKNETIIYNAPSSLSEEEESFLFQNVETGNQTLGDCCICRSTLSGPGTAVVLKGCNHHFHRDCIHRAVQHSRKCPLCRVEIGEPRRTMPSGKMFVRFDETGTCSSFSQGCIVLRYNLARGIQKSYHGSPGLPFQGAERTAFLPDNEIGKKLLTRLKYAFQHGLTFYVAAASSTSSDRSVIWAIPHKTKLDGQGTAGFPDPTYFFKVNQELDLLGVPSAETLEASKPRSRRHKDSETRRQHQNLPRAPPLPADLRQTIEYEAPEMLPTAGVFKTVRQPVRKKKLFRLKTSGRSTGSDPVCGVCFESLSGESVELNECGHQFHTTCIQAALGQRSKCPCCEIVVNSQQGTMPSGNMIIIFDPDRAHGGKIGCIVVRYLIQSGRQKVYHPFPGNAHCSVDKLVYLSGGDAGLNLLLRLRYAFSKGLTFRVSASQSANGRNQLSWAIPHPDENGDYLPNCNRALDRFGVPSGEELRRATI